MAAVVLPVPLVILMPIPLSQPAFMPRNASLHNTKSLIPILFKISDILIF